MRGLRSCVKVNVNVDVESQGESKNPKFPQGEAWDPHAKKFPAAALAKKFASAERPIRTLPAGSGGKNGDPDRSATRPYRKSK